MVWFIINTISKVWSREINSFQNVEKKKNLPAALINIQSYATNERHLDGRKLWDFSWSVRRDGNPSGERAPGQEHSPEALPVSRRSERRAGRRIEMSSPVRSNLLLFSTSRGTERFSPPTRERAAPLRPLTPVCGAGEEGLCCSIIQELCGHKQVSIQAWKKKENKPVSVLLCHQDINPQAAGQILLLKRKPNFVATAAAACVIF